MFAIIFYAIAAGAMLLLIRTLLAPAVRMVASALRLLVAVLASFAVAKLALGSSDWLAVTALAGLFLVGLMSYDRSRAHRREWAARSDGISAVALPDGAALPREASAEPHRPAPLPVASRLPWRDRLGLTRAARDRRDAARWMAEGDAQWDRLAHEASHAASRIAVARRSCARFLAAVTEPMLSPDLNAHAIVVCKRVPQMIERRLKLCADQNADQRRQLIDDLIDQLEAIAAEGERRLAPHGQVQFAELATERAYLRTHLEGASLSSNREA